MVDRTSYLLTVMLPGISGATELPDKLPVHLDTTTLCYPNYMVYSDYGEYYQGQPIIDTLESVSQSIRDKHSDFELYRRLKQHGRSALQEGDFQGGSSEIKKTGNPENPGWKLDKWKFLPMVNRTLYDFPDMKWYVFAEGEAFQTTYETYHHSIGDLIARVHS